MRKMIPGAVLALLLGAAPVFGQSESAPEKVGNAVGDASKQAGAAVNDSWITGQIKQQFLVDSLVKGSQISVTTQKHDVTLTGSVQSDAAHDRALSIAQNTKGVQDVTDNLKVIPAE